MRIVIDGILSDTYVRGVSNYTNHLLRQLASLDKTDEFYVFYGSWMKNYDFLKIKQDNFHFIQCHPPQNKLLRNFYKCFILLLKAKRLKPDIYHVTDTSPLIYHICNTVSTIHDLAEYTVPEKYGKLQAMFRKLYLPFQIKNSTRIITVSEFSKKTIIDKFHVNSSRVIVTYNGIGLKESDKNNNITYEERKYFICVSALEKSKNVITLVKAYAILPKETREKYPLILIGYKSSEYEEILQLIKNKGIEQQVEICDYIRYDKLQEYYRYALALVFPSLYEGFGMPIAESFYYNTPVIASNASCFPEICGGSALMFSPLDEHECALQMSRFAQDKSLWDNYRLKGLERLKEFSWKKTARKTLDEYRSISKVHKKKILYVVEALGGGVYYQVRDLVNYFEQQYDVYLLYAPRKELPVNYKNSFGPNVKLLRYPLSVINENGKIHHVHGIKYTRKIIKSLKPDIIHLHSSIAGAWGRLAFCNTPSKMFYTPHGYAFLNGTPAAKMMIYKIVEAILARKHCMIAACGKQEYAIAREFSNNVVLVENGIRINKYCPKVKKEDSVFTVMTIGRVCTQKNPELFNRIATELSDIRFIWCGDDCTKYFTAPNIVVKPFLPHDEVIKLIQESDAFILTSVFEGLSLSLLEALLYGKLCIVSDTYGNSEVIKDGINGFLCNTYEEYIDVINRIKNNQDNTAFELIRENARQTVINNYSTESMFNKYSKLYD